MGALRVATTDTRRGREQFHVAYHLRVLDKTSLKHDVRADKPLTIEYIGLDVRSYFVAGISYGSIKEVQMCKNLSIGQPVGVIYTAVEPDQPEPVPVL